MILYGRYRSPFSRRVAIAMQLLNIEYDHRALTAWTHLDTVRSVNPVGRVPALVIDSGEYLFDSGAILDYLDHLAGPKRSLVPFEEPERHRVLRIVACAMGALEKVVAALYEQTMHPPEKIHDPWVKHNENQARSGFAWLEEIDWATRLGQAHSISQAEITTVVTYDFTSIVAPHLLDGGKFPKLRELSVQCNQIPAFSDTFPSGEVDKADPILPGSTGTQ